MGVLATIVAVIIALLLPTTAPMADGYITPVIAFELAQTTEELQFLSGGSNAAIMRRGQFYDGLAWDMLFPWLYGGFIFLLLVKALRAEGSQQRKSTKMGVVAAMLIPLCDMAENMSMIRIIDAFNTPQLITHGMLSDELVTGLQITTWAKWLMIGGAMTMLMVHFVRHRYDDMKKPRMAIAVSGFCGVSTLAAFVSRSPILGEIMGLSVVLCIAYFLVSNSRELLHYVRLKRDELGV